MCGIAGIFDVTTSGRGIDTAVLASMTDSLKHRGPDYYSYTSDENVGFGFNRLSIVDLNNGQQPFYSPDGSVMMVCNGEIYNYRELKKDLEGKGHKFRTNCDVEVILFLYLEYKTEFLNLLNGQFSFAVFDSDSQTLFIARDHFGICPLFYTQAGDQFIFASEIKAILQHPLVTRDVDLTGLDQVLSFPATISPRTMFRGIHRLSPGHFIVVSRKGQTLESYWDVNYPIQPYDYPSMDEKYYIDSIEALLYDSVRYRLNADVPIGFYLSGGLDSSLIGAIMKQVQPKSDFQSFSISFPNMAGPRIDERKFQQIASNHIRSYHHTIDCAMTDIGAALQKVVYHSESPLKETYNTCSYLLSKTLNERSVKVALCGEGADELFGGYYGYRMDAMKDRVSHDDNLASALNEEMRESLWGDRDFSYELDHYAFDETRRALYSSHLNESLHEFDSLKDFRIDTNKLSGRHVFHKRSYLDIKIRLAEHLIADHGDRMTYANGVEGRYPFLDKRLVEFMMQVPPELNLKGMVEKYLLKKVSARYLPSKILNREKFAFVAPGSPHLLQARHAWINDLLSYDTIKRQGYFNPDAVEALKKKYSDPHFTLNVPYESDLLLIVLTFGIFLECFQMKSL